MLLLKRTGERGERRPKIGLVLGSRQELKVIFGQLGLETLPSKGAWKFGKARNERIKSIFCLLQNEKFFEILLCSCIYT